MTTKIPGDSEGQRLEVMRQKISSEGDAYVYSFSVKTGERTHDIWYRLPFLPVDNGNVAFATTLLPAMKLGLPLRVEGPVSDNLIRSHQKIQDIFRVWDETFNVIPVTAETDVRGAESGKKGVACFFSGGVDSFFTLLKHEREITHLVLMHGFDFKPDFTGKEKVAKAVAEIASKLGKSVIEIATNLRGFSDFYVPWAFYHGSALAAAALLISSKVKKVYIPSSHSFRCLVPWGSHFIVDPLWGLEDMEIVHDGCEATRVKKVEFLSQHDVAMGSLRVCWQNEIDAYNCGKCEKCLRTMLNLLVVGALDQCRTFCRSLELWRVPRLTIDNEGTRDFILENLEAAKRFKVDFRAIDALEDCLSGLYHKGIWGWPRRALNFVRRRGSWNVARR